MGGRTASAETGHDGWLRYAPLSTAAQAQLHIGLPETLVVGNSRQVTGTAAAELADGIERMTGHRPAVGTTVPAGGAFVIGTVEDVARLVPGVGGTPPGVDGFRLHVALSLDRLRAKGAATPGSTVVVAGQSDRGTLYGVFALLRLIGQHGDLSRLDVTETPSAPQRWTNEWDNLDGIDRARLRRPVDLLRPGSRRLRSHGGARVRAAAGIGGHQRLRGQQRQCQLRGADRRVSSRAGADCRRVQALRRPAGDRRGLLEPEEHRRARHLRPARPSSRSRSGRRAPTRAYAAHPRPRRVRPEGRFRRQARAVGVRPDPCRRRQRPRPCPRAARRRHLLSGLRLRPPHGLAQPEKRSSARGVGQLS